MLTVGYSNKIKDNAYHDILYTGEWEMNDYKNTSSNIVKSHMY